MGRNGFSKDEILSLVKQNLSVAQMAEKLGVSESALERFYIECFKENRYDFPLSVLLTKEWLEEKIKTSSILSISVYVGSTPAAVRNLLEKYGLKKMKLREVLTPEVLYSLYIKKRMTAPTIAKMYHCSLDSVKKITAEYHLNTSDRAKTYSKISQEFFHLLYFKIGFTAKQLSEMIGCAKFYITDTLLPQMISEGGPLADDLKGSKPTTSYQKIVELLYGKAEPSVLLEQLRTHTFTQVAEMYGIIPETGRELFSKEWLEYLMRQMTLYDISQKCHIPYYYVKKLRAEFDIPFVSADDRMDEDLIRRLFVDNNWTDKEIARSLDVSEFSVNRFRNKRGIVRKKSIAIKDKIPLADFERLFLTEGLTLKQIAELYSVAPERINDLYKKYCKVNSELEDHTPTGVSEQMMQFLKKEIKFKGFK